MNLNSIAKSVAKRQAEVSASDAHTRLPLDIRAATGYNPRQWQIDALKNERRFNVRVIHRRAGKSVLELNKMTERAIWCPFKDGRYAYLGPTYSQVEDIVWTYLTEVHDAIMEHCKLAPSKWVNKSKLEAFFPSYIGSKSRVRLYGMDSPKQRVRGLYLDGVIFDEYPWIPPSAWSEQVRPMLTDENRHGEDALGRVNQWGDFIFTPFGRNHGHTMFRNAKVWMEGGTVVVNDPILGTKTEVSRDDFTAMILKASESGVLAEDELLSAKIDMGPAKYEQEYECSFDAAVEGAIFAKALELARTSGRIGRVPVHPLLPVNTAWDLGFDDATAIWFFQQVGRDVNVIDYEEYSGAGLDFYADLLAEKNYRYGYHLFPHDVEVHELGSGKTRASLLRQLGIRVSTVQRVQKKADAIAAGDALLARASFDEHKCADGLDRLALYRREYNERLGVFREKPVHDWASHGADAWETLSVGLRNIRAGGGANNQHHGVF